MPTPRHPKRASPESRLLDGEAAGLSNADLLAVLLGDTSVVRDVQATYATLADLEAAPAEELRGVGLDITATARLLASTELARRRAQERARRGTPILDPGNAYELLAGLLRGETREVVVVLALDTKNRLICPPLTVAVGTVDRAPLHPREVFRPLIRVSAAGFLLAHLHPSSGEPVPSPDDVVMTRKLKEAADLLGIPLLDHLVIGEGSYVSMAERGLM